MATVEVRRERSDVEPGASLVAAMVAEVEGLYGPFGPSAPSADPEDFDPSRGGAFVVVYEDGTPVAGGGVKRLEEGVAEVKRMYVVPAARSRGHSRRLLEALEAEARALGYARVRLDTGHSQPRAEALYRSAGYRDIPAYNVNPNAAFWFEKALR